MDYQLNMLKIKHVDVDELRILESLAKNALLGQRAGILGNSITEMKATGEKT